MWNYPTFYDVIVVGGGHAGCEAAFASSLIGAKTLLLTMNLDTIAIMSCNPSIGGTAKGHIVREIDALGGLMGKIADRTCIHFRMLNSSKGPAVRSPRAQADKAQYHLEMKHTLEKTPNLEIKQATIEKIIVENNLIKGVYTKEGILFLCKNLVICSGTFMQGVMHIGMLDFPGGRGGDLPSIGLSSSLKELGIKIGRLKTGTPPRINKRSIDFSKVELQIGEDGVKFSFDDEKQLLNKKTPCLITYTTPKTKEIILRDMQKSALYSGKITGVGPRYCPSIETKIERFANKERHQVFLEPEGLNTEEFYINGLSSSMPFSTQLETIQSIIGLENAEIMRPAYAIEYDYVLSSQIEPTLETKLIKGLFLAGQINGTTGYEEAAAQGLIAGINAANKSLNKESFILDRSESYIGVMIDDLISKELTEPYRMFTSRAEHRLLLRQDNADLRLRPYGYNLGLISKEKYDKVLYKQQTITQEVERLSKIFKKHEDRNFSLSRLLCRPTFSYKKLLEEFNNDVKDFGEELNEQIELFLKYEGYIERQQKEVLKLQELDKIKIPENISYDKVTGLRNEAKEKLKQFLPRNLGIASRILGVSIADISILMVSLQKK
jgi:tRNA uridine 5-carboxymethylaminomethyl modification enzyme